MILLTKSVNRLELKIFFFLAQFQHKTNKNMLILAVVMAMKRALFMVFIKPKCFPFNFESVVISYCNR